MTPERKRCGNHAGPDFTPCTRDADHTGPCAHALKEHPAPSMMLTPAMEAEIREHVAMRWTRYTWLGALLTRADSLAGELATLRAAYVGLRVAARRVLDAPEPPYEYSGGCFAECRGKPAGCCADCEDRCARFGVLDDLLSLAEEAERG